MGTLRFTVHKPARTGAHQGTGILIGRIRTSGVFNTGTSATNIQDVAAATVNLAPGEILSGVASTDMWVNPYGTATVGTGILFQSGVLNTFEFDPQSDASGAKAARTVSAIEG